MCEMSKTLRCDSALGTDRVTTCEGDDGSDYRKIKGLR